MTDTADADSGSVLTVEAGQACFVYGIVPAATRLPEDLAGLAGHPPQLLRHGDVAALVDVVDVDRGWGTRGDLLTYSHVVDAVAAGGQPVLPARFGSVLASTDEVTAELLEPNHEEFTALLDGLRGRSQYTLRVRYQPDVALAEVVAERADIAALREETRDQPEEVTYHARIRLGELVSDALAQKRSRDAEPIIDVVTAPAVDFRVRELAGKDDVVEVALLMDQAAVPALEKAAEAIAEQGHDRMRMQLRGPSAPYDFVPEV
ncbi:GvpL/GvpF family gas vesicle protein [Isoptericola cucumis]|uniref:Gas vesicle synthesis GvpLGvpF n=1 Tax=Isoptericola cucumis TaxID=1776856 RepID=A0ABQ2B6W6_9MICO|nr:GvpL/GvpF family gas vesicle protein [Isoptericola cucumis]GGI06746.1 hypothetical protein GCM10007368_12700 [Isoptericola cucumis]